MDPIMKPRSQLLSALVILLLWPPPGGAQEELLRIEASAVPRRLYRGEEGHIVLKLGVEPGITVSPHPEFIVEFKPSEDLIFPKNFFTATDLGVDTLEKDGQTYLSFDEPLRVPLTVSPKARRGSYILEGRIKYCALSRAEGWCVKNIAKFYVAYSTRTAAAAKKS
jgi:hypothetical protein